MQTGEHDVRAILSTSLVVLLSMMGVSGEGLLLVWLVYLGFIASLFSISITCTPGIQT